MEHLTVHVCCNQMVVGLIPGGRMFDLALSTPICMGAQPGRMFQECTTDPPPCLGARRDGNINGTCGLVAVKSASHAEGRQFDPGQVHCAKLRGRELNPGLAAFSLTLSQLSYRGSGLSLTGAW